MSRGPRGANYLCKFTLPGGMNGCCMLISRRMVAVQAVRLGIDILLDALRDAKTLRCGGAGGIWRRCGCCCCREEFCFPVRVAIDVAAAV